MGGLPELRLLLFARETGPFPHWTPLAGYLTVILLVGFWCLLFSVELPISRPAVGVILLLGAVSLLLSAEISALIGTVIGAVLLGLWAGCRKQMVRWLITALIVVVALRRLLFRKTPQHRVRLHGGKRQERVRSPDDLVPLADLDRSVLPCHRTAPDHRLWPGPSRLDQLAVHRVAVRDDADGGRGSAACDLRCRDGRFVSAVAPSGSTKGPG